MPYNKIQFTTGLFYNVHSNSFCTGKLLQICLIVKVSLNDPTDNGRPMKPFFIEIQNFLGLGRQIGLWGIFDQTISIHFGAVSPLSMFSIIQPLFLQRTKPLYSHSNIYLGLGFEFGPQRIRDLAFVCP